MTDDITEVTEVPEMKIVSEVGTTLSRVFFAALVALGLVGASLVAGASSPAQACSCVALDLPSLAKQGDAVFVGTPVGSDEDGDTRTYEVRVSDIYKGSAGPTTMVETEASAATCGAELELDRQYVIVADATGEDGTVTTAACSGTQPVSDQALADVERAFGPATPYRGPAGDNDADEGGTDKGGTDKGADKTDGSDGSADSDEAAESGDSGGTDASYAAIGGVLVVALGAAFLVPKLRRRNRS